MRSSMIGPSTRSTLLRSRVHRGWRRIRLVRLHLCERDVHLLEQLLDK